MHRVSIAFRLTITDGRRCKVICNEKEEGTLICHTPCFLKRGKKNSPCYSSIYLLLCSLSVFCWFLLFFAASVKQLNSIVTMIPTNLAVRGCRARRTRPAVPTHLHFDVAPLSSFYHVPPCDVGRSARCTNLFDLYFIYSPINRRLRLNVDGTH